MLNNQIVNGLELHRDGDFLCPIINNKPYKKIVIQETDQKTDFGGRVFSVIRLQEQKDGSGVTITPTEEIILKDVVEFIHKEIENNLKELEVQ